MTADSLDAIVVPCERCGDGPCMCNADVDDWEEFAKRIYNAHVDAITGPVFPIDGERPGLMSPAAIELAMERGELPTNTAAGRLMAAAADELSPIILPDECSPLEMRLLELLSVADAQTHAALQSVRDLVMLVRSQSSFLFQDQQDIVTAAQLLLDEHGVEWRAPVGRSSR